MGIRFFFVFSVSIFLSSAALAQSQPNILWIIADDMSPDIGAYGYEGVSTPNLDRLAAEGTRYNRAYSTAAVCSASRSAVITGMYQNTIGAQSHRLTSSTKDLLPAGIAPITEYFRDQGYYVTNSNWNVSGNGKTDYNFRSGISGGMYDGYDWAGRSNNQPFFAQVQIFDPHRDFRSNPDPTRIDRVNLPDYYPDDDLARADWANYLTSVEEVDRKVGVVLDRLEAQGLADNTIVMFFGDHGRAHVRDKQWLYDGGIRVPLIIRDPSQAGGQVSEEAVSLIDVSAGSLALSGADLPSHLQGVNMFDENFDGRDAVFAARDRAGNVVDRVRSVQVGDLKLIHNFFPELPYMTGDQESYYKRLEYPVHTLLLELHEQGKLTPEQALFLASSRPEFELYDLSADPFELNNLADDPSYASPLAEMRALIEAHLLETDAVGGYPGDTAEEAALAQSSVNWGTNRLASRGFGVNGDRTLELDYWEGILGVESSLVPEPGVGSLILLSSVLLMRRRRSV